jgi:hypothetical protein
MSRFASLLLQSALILALATSGSLLAATPTGTVRGAIVDVVGVPISRAFVLIHSDFKAGMDKTVVLDDQGRFAADLAPGIYSVFVSSASFAPSCDTIEILSDKTIHFSAKLKPDMKHMQQDVTVSK